MLYSEAHFTSSELLVRPRNTFVLSGRGTSLDCRTNSTSTAELSWKFTSADGEEQTFIYNDNGLNPAFSNRGISVNIDQTTRDYRLVFRVTDLNSAGTYTCQDGGGQAHGAWLAVLGQ